MNIRSISIFFLLVTFLVSKSYMANAQSTDNINGIPVITLTPQEQIAENIKTTPLKNQTLLPEKAIYATVIDLKPLFDLRSRWATTKSDYKITKLQLNNAKTEYQRSEKLFKQHHDTSLKTLQNNQVLMQTYKARLQSQATELKDIMGIITQKYGRVLAKSVYGNTSALFQHLLNRDYVILSVPIPDNMKRVPPKNIKVIGPADNVLNAKKLSVSPLVNPLVQGNAYLYLVAQNLPTGLRTAAYIPITNKAVSGYLIPENAIFWYAGQPWVFVQQTNNKFIRHALGKTYTTKNGIFTTTSFGESHTIVRQGAQLLFSEEQKQKANSGSIITSQCPDPPECDG